MNKKLKILVIILLVLLIGWGIIFGIDYFRVANFKMPIFVRAGETADDGGSGTYYGLGYRVEVEKNISAEYGIYLEKIEMYMFDKIIMRAIANIDVYYDMSSTEGIKTVLTLEDEIQNDSIWCGTFQLIWNDLKNDLAKQDIVFTPQTPVIENLNKETFTTEAISDKYYYKKVGSPSIALKEEIEKAIKDKFNEKSKILDDFEWEGRDPKDYFLYAMLKKEFKFEKAFEKLEDGEFGKYANVKYFGIKSDDLDELRRQVDVLYYNSKDDFAIKLETKQEDEVILCKNPQGNTFNEIYNNILTQKNAYKGSRSIQEGELLKVPNIKLNEKNEFKEIQNQPFSFSNGDIYTIEKAIQTIEFELDREGGKIKSEAGMMANYESAMMVTEEIREFFIDDTFVIFLIEEDKDTPYFAGKIQDITKFQ